MHNVEPYFLSPEYTQGTPFVLTSSPTRSSPFLLSSGVNNFLHVDQYGSMESTNFWDVGLVTRSGRVVHPSNLSNDKGKTHAEIIKKDNEVTKQLKRT